MKYTVHHKLMRVLFLVFMVVWGILFGGGCVVFLMVFCQEPSVTLLPAFLMLAIMAAGYAFVSYHWLHAITEIALENGTVTFTYLTGRQEVVPVEDITTIRQYSGGYILQTARKSYPVAVRFHYATMSPGTIDFLRPVNFPNAAFERK